jgi:hypothetical protein
MRNEEIYQGHLVNGKMQGQGVYYWPNGDRFEGHFEDDKRCQCSKTFFSWGPTLRLLINNSGNIGI